MKEHNVVALSGRDSVRDDLTELIRDGARKLIAEGLEVGAQAKGFSASTVSRLKQQWLEDYEAWRHRRRDQDRWVYVWADGIYSGLRAERQWLCALVIVGVNERGEKHFLAIEDGIRESTQSWREVLLDLKARGLNAPELAVGDGALGFWAALEEVFPATRQQRCWMHYADLQIMPTFCVEPPSQAATVARESA
jgi:transposase-like protein